MKYIFTLIADSLSRAVQKLYSFTTSGHAIMPKLILSLMVCLFLTKTAYPQAVRTGPPNKIGFLVQLVPQEYSILTNTVSGEKKKTSISAVGFEIFYERIIDDYFAYGTNFNFWTPPEFKMTIANSYSPYVGTSIPRQLEQYTVNLNEFGVGAYMKAYLAPNRTPGIKLYMQTGLTYLFTTAAIDAMVQKPTPVGAATPNDELIPYKKDLNHSILVKYVGVGSSYNFKIGISVQAAVKLASGLSTVKLGADPASQGFSKLNLQTLIFEMGTNYSF